MLLKDFMVLSERPLDANGQLIRENGRIALSPDGQMIENNANVVCSLLALHLKGKVRTPNFWRICLLLNHSHKTTRELSVSGGVVNHYCDLNIEEYKKRLGDDRGEVILNFIVKSSVCVFEHFGISTEAMFDARKLIHGQKFVAKFRGKTTKISDSRRVAYVEVLQELDVSKVHLVVKEGSREMYRKEIAIDATNPFQFQNYFGVLEWLSYAKLRLTCANDKSFEICL